MFDTVAQLVVAAFCFMCAVSAQRSARRAVAACDTISSKPRELPAAAPRQLPYRTSENPNGDPALAVEMAETRQRNAEDERDSWRRLAERYEHALRAIHTGSNSPACRIAQQALVDGRGA